MTTIANGIPLLQWHWFNHLREYGSSIDGSIKNGGAEGSKIWYDGQFCVPDGLRFGHYSNFCYHPMISCPIMHLQGQVVGVIQKLCTSRVKQLFIRKLMLYQ